MDWAKNKAERKTNLPASDVEKAESKIHAESKNDQGKSKKSEKIPGRARTKDTAHNQRTAKKENATE